MRTLEHRTLSRRVLAGGALLPEGIAGHWVSSDVTASPVGFWPDRSGNGLDMGQTTGGAQPVLTPGGLAGRPVVTFDGVNDYLLGPDISQSQPFTVIGVVRHHNADTAQRGFFGGNHGVQAGPVVYAEGGVWRLFAGSNLISSIPVDDEWHVVVGRWDSGTGTLWVDAVGVAGSVGTRTISVPRLGGYGNNNTNLIGPWDGDIAEVVFWDRALSNDEVTAAREMLAHKYGLSL